MFFFLEGIAQLPFFLSFLTLVSLGAWGGGGGLKKPGVISNFSNLNSIKAVRVKLCDLFLKIIRKYFGMLTVGTRFYGNYFFKIAFYQNCENFYFMKVLYRIVYISRLLYFF